MRTAQNGEGGPQKALSPGNSAKGTDLRCCPFAGTPRMLYVLTWSKALTLSPPHTASGV